MKNMKHPVVTLASVAALLGAVLLAASSATTSEQPAPMGFGMAANAVARQAAAGAAPDYGSLWIGPWTLSSGWGGPDAQLQSLKDAGVTPAVHFYYWGDDISIDCLENGCWSSLHNTQKNHAGWDLLAQQFADHLNAKMGGLPVVIFLETEFNKGGVATYEPLDGYLAAKADFFHQQYPAARVVMALGNWNSAAWSTWDRTAAASDYTGIQGLRSSNRQSLSAYMGLYDAVLAGAKTLKTMFGKPIIIQDIGLSSYPEPEYLDHQAAALKMFFTGLPELKAEGVIGLLYRSWTDNPNMNVANYHGEAERHWGLAWTMTGAAKASGDVWVAGVKAERAGPSPSPSPTPVAPIEIGAGGGMAEVEAFGYKSTGGRQSDSAASANAGWNLWSNGFVQQGFSLAPGEFDVTVRARGTTVDGVGPRLILSVGDTPLLSADPGISYGDFRGRIAGGSVTDLKIWFTNDVKSSTEDRNLIVDKVSFAAANRAPVAGFTASGADLQAAFDAAGSSDPDGDVLTFAWSFGDGAKATGMKVSHAYAAPGTYLVVLSASDGRLSSSESRSVVMSAPAFSATFKPTSKINAWWVEVVVTASNPVSKVEASVNGGAWVTLSPTEWGKWAKSMNAPKGSSVVFRATDGFGQKATSPTIKWMADGFSAQFSPKSQTNVWWVEVGVTGTSPINSVDARLNGGAWTTLPATSWGTYAKSLHAAKGTVVEFRATSTSGASVISAAYTWG